MNFYITSDQHFMHFNIIKYANRPFELSNDGVIDNISVIGKNYNSLVQEEDLVFHLGDLGHGRAQNHENIGHILSNLKGRKILLKGNHDRWDDSFYLKYFEQVKKYLIVDSTFFCHYPCYEVHDNVQEEVQLIKVLKGTSCTKIFHGHIHDKDPAIWQKDGYIRTNFSVDFPPNNYFPIQITNPKMINFLLEKYK